MAKSWRDIAIEFIAPLLLEYEAQQVLLNKEIDPAEFRKWANKNHYPFGQRAFLPYKTWLEETRLAETFLATGRQAREYPAWRSHVTKDGHHHHAPVESPGQLSLI